MTVPNLGLRCPLSCDGRFRTGSFRGQNLECDRSFYSVPACDSASAENRLETMTGFALQGTGASELTRSRLRATLLTNSAAGQERLEAALKTIYTLGYEGAALPDFIRTLEDTGVSLLLDIRELPQSRRPGFSKRALSEALADAGIAYRHVRQLGDPKPGRDAARRGAMEEFRSIFNAHLDLEACQKALQEVAQDADAETVVLMCYERAPHDCHRSLVAQHLVHLRSFRIVHLDVQIGRAVRRDEDGAAARRVAGAR